MFCTALLCIVLAVMASLIPFIPSKKRRSILLFGALIASIAATAVIVVIPFMQMKLTKKQSQEITVTLDRLDTPPWSHFARLIKNPGFMKPCTVTLLSPDLALVPAQCVTSILSESGFARPDHLSVEVPGRTMVGVREYVVGPDFDAGVRDFPSAALHDWALLRLAQPVNVENEVFTIPPGDRSSVSASSELTKNLLTAGYMNQIEKQLKVIRPCHLLTEGFYRFLIEHGGVDDHYTLHDCANWGAAVGAPLLRQKQDGTYEVLAIHAGGVAAYNTLLGVAVPLTGIAYENGRVPY